MKKRFALLTCLLLLFSLSACGASDKMMPFDTAATNVFAADSAAVEALEAPKEAYRYDAKAKTEEEGFFEPTAGGGENAVRDAKIVYTANLDLETTEFDRATQDITSTVEQFDGYLASSSGSNRGSGYRYADYTVKVPTEKFNAFLTQIGETCAVTYSNTSAEDITDSYYDVDSRLKTAQTKLTRLQELLAKAESMADIITIESAISDTEWEIENLTGTLRTYDKQVDYATVYLSLREVYKLSDTENAPLTLGARIGSAFVRGAKSVGSFFTGLLVFLAYSWLWLAAIAVAAVVLVRVIKKKRSRKKSGE